MSSSVFKRLFEVRILHDYFLTSGDGTSFFDLNQTAREKVLRSRLARQSYGVHDLLGISPDGATARRMKEYKLLLRKTALGFVAGLEVDPELQAGATLYRPRFDLPVSFNLTFALTPVLPYFSGITAISFNPAFPALYYFTNRGKEVFNEPSGPGFTSLALSAQPREHQPGLHYEMGAITSFGGVLREALQHTDGSDPAHWEDTPDRRFVTEADRILLPSSFTFVLRKEDAVTQFEALLEDQSGEEVKSTVVNSPDAMTSVLLDFSRAEGAGGEPAEIPDGFYTLKISTNGGPEIIYPVYLNPAIYRNDALGVVEIRLDETDSPFSLLDAAGYLKTRMDAAGQQLPHPVFEIRFRNRRTYWRYRKDGDFSAAEVAATTPFLELQAGNLVSKKPKALTDTLVPFQNGSSLMLPHPATGMVKVEQAKIFSEVHIHPANRLIDN